MSKDSTARKDRTSLTPQRQQGHKQGWGFVALACLPALVLYLILLLHPPAQSHLTTAGDGRTHVIIVSIDGLRPDVALRTSMPHLRGLMSRGAFTFWAHTTNIAITLPSHTSMLTGVVAERHRILWNTDVEDADLVEPPSPSLFHLAKEKGYTTAISVGKSKLRQVPGKAAIDWQYLPDGYASSPGVAAHAADIIRNHRPNVLFVHFPDTDAAGHGSGWGSPGQLEAAAAIDAALGVVLQAVADAGIASTTTIIVSADHGGSGWSHGPDDLQSRLIPWIIAGPHTKSNFDLTQETDLAINTEDTFATACWVLGIPLPQDCDGKPVTLAFIDPPETRELLEDLE